MRTVRSVQGDTIDLICLRHYGRTQGVVEAVYAANPALADQGPVLPRNTLVKMPEDVNLNQDESIKLWD